MSWLGTLVFYYLKMLLSQNKKLSTTFTVYVKVLGQLASGLGQSAASARPISSTENLYLEIEPSEKENRSTNAWCYKCVICRNLSDEHSAFIGLSKVFSLLMIYFSVLVKECLQSETIYIFSIMQKKLLQLASGLLASSLGQSAASARPVSFTEIQDLQIEPSEKETHINKRMMR